MTLLKRILTAIVLFGFLFVVVYIGVCFIGGAISGGMAGAANPENSAEAGSQAGVNFVRHNLRTILLGAVGISLVSSLALSFSGILPWCRKPQPPKM